MTEFGIRDYESASARLYLILELAVRSIVCNHQPTTAVMLG